MMNDNKPSSASQFIVLLALVVGLVAWNAFDGIVHVLCDITIIRHWW